MIRAVWFDAGETLVDETGHWQAVADRLGVPRFTLMGVLGGLAERREPHTRVFELLGVEPPVGGFDAPAGALYPDAAPCLRALAEAGYAVGVCGNQPRTMETWLAETGIAAGVITSSASLGVAKPDPAFFTALAALTGHPPAETAYIGDRVDFDVLPAIAAGLAAVLIRRGPWGILQAEHPDAGAATLVVESLHELAGRLARITTRPS